MKRRTDLFKEAKRSVVNREVMGTVLTKGADTYQKGNSQQQVDGSDLPRIWLSIMVLKKWIVYGWRIKDGWGHVLVE
jgi:hypothetical protein